MPANRARGLDWQGAQAPSLAELEAIADQAFKRLPRRFRDLCKDVVIRVEDFPTDEVLDALGAESAFDLLGLYHGVDLVAAKRHGPCRAP